MSDLPVVVIGAGPAGSTAAALLARHGLPVVLLERAWHPRHHVGESLQPATFELLERHLGLGATMAAQGFARKYGAVYVWGDSRDPWTVLFDGRLERDLPGLDEQGLLAGDYEHAWQVSREVFDALLFEAAVAAGVDARQGTVCEGVVVEQGRVVGVQVQGSTIPARWVVDASGQTCLVGRSLGHQQVVTDLRSSATYGYFRGAGGVPGPLGRHVQLVVSVDDGWVWFIPTSPELTSVGVVTPQGRRLDEAGFAEACARAELPLAGGAREGGLRFARDWSYHCRQVTGAGWTLVGDAACFVDPILSGGVDFAIRGAANAAVALLGELDGSTPGALDAYGQRLEQEYRAYLRLARYWYGNNRSVSGLFWEAHRSIPPHSASTPLRAFVYLTSGRLAAERHLRVFQEWQERKMFRALGVDREALQEALGGKLP